MIDSYKVLIEKVLIVILMLGVSVISVSANSTMPMQNKQASHYQFTKIKIEDLPRSLVCVLLKDYGKTMTIKEAFAGSAGKKNKVFKVVLVITDSRYGDDKVTLLLNKKGKIVKEFSKGSLIY